MIRILDIAAIDKGVKIENNWRAGVYPVYSTESAGESDKHNSKHTAEKYKSFKDQNEGVYAFLKESGVRDLTVVLKYFTMADVEEAVKSKKVFIKKTKIFI